MKEIRVELDEARTTYFATEAVSRGGRSQVALQNVHNLQKRIETTTAALARLSAGEAIVRSTDHEDFSKATSLLTDHLQHLGKIQQSYQRIVVDSGLSKTTLPVTSEDESALTQESRVIPARSGVFQSLDNLSRSQSSSPQETKFNLLLELENIPQEQEENLILGSRGEIKFVAPSTNATATSRSKQDGLNLVRLAIFRDYGEAGLRHFDRHFNTQLMSEHPITVGQLMDFVDEENKVNPKVFYLSSIHSLHELIVGESHSDDDHKPVQAGSSTFKLTAAKDDRGTDSTPAQKKQAALKATRQAIVEFFKELPSEKRQHILQRFNDEFKGEEAKPLTVQNLRSFLKKELENERSILSRSPLAEALF